ncbi:MAG: Na+/H+ antiporter subunit E [Gammaproteobacteria bacterium]|nr:Na+/H+ antiporter subunit E [Gammaproteobacteria bacterium]
MIPTISGEDQGPWLKRLVLFAIAFLFWLILVWPVSPLDGSLLVGDIVAGLFAAALVALVMGEMIRTNLIRLLRPRCWFWLIVYLFVFSYYVFRGGIDVAYRVFHPAMPIKPGIVRIKSVLQTETGRSVLANSITLTPGTLTIDVTDDGVFYVHWLNVRSDNEQQIYRQVLQRFEWFVQRIFE